MPKKKLIYEAPKAWTHAAVDAAVAKNDPKELALMIIGVALEEADLAYAQDLCVRLATHPDEWVRGNAIMGFGHLARLHRRLDRKRVIPLITAALKDPSARVRGMADDAKSDTRVYLRWRYPRK